MRSLNSVVMTLGCALVLGCAAPESPAQAQENGRDRPTSRQAQGEKKARFRAEILERGKDKPFELKEVVLFVPEVSLFGGSGGDESDVLEVRRGATRLEVPLDRLVSIEISEPDPDADRIEVTIQLRPADGGQQPPPLRGSVKANLELRGLYEGLKAVIKLREAKRITLAVQGS